jgi:plastocyanin
MGISNRERRKYQYTTFRAVVILAGVLCFCFLITSLSTAQNVTIQGTVNLEPAGSLPVGSGSGGYGNTSGTGAGNQSSENSIILWLESNDPDVSPQNQNADDVRVLNQKNQQFQPRLTAIRKGSIVRIKNSDPVYHNVFSLSKTKAFDVGRRSPNDPPRDQRFDKAGIVDVFCDIHSDMHAVIVVLPEQTVRWEKLENEGSFSLTNIAPGAYTLHFYAMGDRSRTIQIDARQGENVDLGIIQLGS